MGNFGIPPEKAGLLLSNIFQSAPGVARERRLPELAFDLASCVASMKVTDAVRQQVLDINCLFPPLLLYTSTHAHTHAHTHARTHTHTHTHTRFCHCGTANLEASSPADVLGYALYRTLTKPA